MGQRSASLTINGAAPIELPIRPASVGPDVIDVGALTHQGFFTYDPGFVSTAACESAITYIDGDAGVLLHRGYPIEQLVEQSDFLELCYLLLHDHLPSAAQRDRFVASVREHGAVDERFGNLFSGFRRDAHPMAILCGVTAALASLYHDELDLDDPDYRDATARRLIGKMPALAAMCYRHARGEPFVAPRPDLPYAENFLHMMFAPPGQEQDYEVNPVVARAFDRIFLLHADHEQNASTSTVRLAGSTGANPFACIAAGIAALWGPAHGGANEQVLNMFAEIGSPDNIDRYIARAKDRDDPFRVMGFGHRVYKNYDPRATVMQQTCHEVLAELGVDRDPTLQMAQRLEKIALEDEYFVTKRLYPNVDFYSGIILKAVGIPVELFTVIFATGRAPGWIAHWREMVSSPYKLARPRQLYTGPARREYVPMSARA